MPLYTYIATFKGSSYVAQGSYSNFRGFVSAWSGELPDNALPGLTAALRKELISKAYHGDFLEVPNRKHVWRNVIDLNGSEFAVYAIQTQL